MRTPPSARINPNFRTKKALHAALFEGQEVYVFQPGDGPDPVNCEIDVSGPWYTHLRNRHWTATVQTDAKGRIVKLVR